MDKKLRQSRSGFKVTQKPILRAKTPGRLSASRKNVKTRSFDNDFKSLSG